MKTSIEFISDLKIKSGISSDYALAKLLGVTKVTISHYQNGKTLIGDATAIRVAELLDLDPAFVVACIHAERAKHEGEKRLWERIAAMASGVTPSQNYFLTKRPVRLERAGFFVFFLLDAMIFAFI